MPKAAKIIIASIVCIILVGGLYFVFCIDRSIKTYSVGELARQGKLEVTIKKIETKDYLLNDEEKSSLEKNRYSSMILSYKQAGKCLVVDIEVKNNSNRPIKFNRFNFNAMTEFTDGTNPMLPEDIKKQLTLTLDKKNLLEYTIFPNTTIEGSLVFEVNKESKNTRITVYANEGDKTGFSGAIFYSGID